MNKIQCSQGHFYDADLYSQCPLCEKMENIGKTAPHKSSKKSLRGKKSEPEPKNVPEQQESVQHKAQIPSRRKKTAPAAGSVVTVAFYNKGTDGDEQPDNDGILDDEGHIVLKSQSKKKAKKVQTSEEYVTASEMIEENEKKKYLKNEEEPEQNILTKPNEPVIKISEDEFEAKNTLSAVSDETADCNEEKIEPDEETASKEKSENEDATERELNKQSNNNFQNISENAADAESNNAQKRDSVANIFSESATGGSKTVGFYHFENDPVVGWLVCLSGDIKGKSFKLKSGQNILGTSGIMDIYLPSDEKSSEAKALLIFEPNKKEFILRANSTQISINDREVKEYSKIKDYDIIAACGYKLIFKSLCNKSFDWKDYE